MIKKGSIFSWALVFVSLIILTTAMLVMIEKKSKFFDRENFFTIGSKQFRVLEAYQKGETALLYLDQTARYSSFQALYDLGGTGGYYNTSPCGNYLGYNIWVNETDCYPTYFKDTFKKLLQDNLERL